MADAAGLRPEPADVAEKLVAREPDAPEQHASHRQSALPAAPAAAKPDAPALCRQVADPSVERSSAAPVAATEPLALPQPEVPWHSQERPRVLEQKAPRWPISADAQQARPAKKMQAPMLPEERLRVAA